MDSTRSRAQRRCRRCVTATAAARRAPWRHAWMVPTTLLTAMVTSLWVSAPVSAQQPPLDTAPTSAGMPGAEFLGQLIGWAKWLGLLACGLVFIYGAATWKGFGSASSARASDGKGYAIGGLVGAAMVGLVGFAIPMLYTASSQWLSAGRAATGR